MFDKMFENKKLLFYLFMSFSLLLIFLAIPIITETVQTGETTTYSPPVTGIILSLLPLAVLTMAFYLRRRRRYKEFYIMIGIALLGLFYEFACDPWSIEFRQKLGLPMSSVLYYGFIAMVILILATFVFKRGMED